MTRPAREYLHGDSVIVPNRVALQIWALAGLDRVQIQARRDQDFQLVEVLEALRIGGQRSKASANRSVVGPIWRPTPDLTSASNYISTRQAADRLHVTPRHIVRLLDRGTLAGIRDATGRWQIDPASLHTTPHDKETP